jgi:hypothetical protein
VSGLSDAAALEARLTFVLEDICGERSSSRDNFGIGLFVMTSDASMCSTALFVSAMVCSGLGVYPVIVRE